MSVSFDIREPFVLRAEILPEDTDELKHANNLAYLRWMMLAARSHSDSLGYTLSRYQELGAAFVVRRHEIDYLAPGFTGDQLEIATWCGEMDKFSAKRHFQLVRASDGKTLARGTTLWIYVDLASGRPRRIPDVLKDVFRPTAP
jgi:acyl-CoA thioester hydrolase